MSKVKIEHELLDSKIATATALFNEWIKWCNKNDINPRTIAQIPNLFLVTQRSSKKKMKSKIIENVMIADEIMADFEERGVAASFVYYELLEMVEKWTAGTLKKSDLVEHLEFIMGFKGEEHFDRVVAQAHKNIKEVNEMIDGTFDETR